LPKERLKDRLVVLSDGSFSKATFQLAIADGEIYRYGKNLESVNSRL